ncbi:Isopentenyl-diphosphate delta-isomerase [Trichinella spiralis]|uniref:Isopentenyl-diphosphate delta-isomerase n=1 Tax=Trichinella spiralis TaxID=6334 RepID=A0ABR3K4T5_TRISP
MGSGAGDAPTASTSVASQRVLRTRVAALSSGQTISGEMVRSAALEAPLSGRHRRTPHSGPPGAQARDRRVHGSFIGDYGSGAAGTAIHTLEANTAETSRNLGVR